MMIISLQWRNTPCFPKIYFQININKKHVISSGIVSAKQEDLIANEIHLTLLIKQKTSTMVD